MADHVPRCIAPSSETSTAPMPNVSPMVKNRASASPLVSSWVQRLVMPENDSLLLTHRLLSVRNGMRVEGCLRNVVPQERQQATDGFVESCELSRFSSQLGDTVKEEEEPDRCGNDKINFGSSMLMSGNRASSGTIQTQQVTGSCNLKQKKDLDAVDVMSEGKTSTVPVTETFNFQPIEILAERQNSSLVNEHSDQLFALKSSVMPRSEQQPQKSSKFMTFRSLEMGETKAEATSCGASTSNISALGAVHTSIRKPPLPPGAVTRTKLGIPLKPNSFHVQCTPAISTIQLKMSESPSQKALSGAESDKQCCAKRRIACSLYERMDNAGEGRGSMAKIGVFNKVVREAIDPILELEKQSEHFRLVYPESIVHGSSLLHPDIVPSRNNVKKKAPHSKGTCFSDCEKAPVLEQREEHLQYPKCSMTSEFLPNTFEEEGRNTEEFTVGESLLSNDESAQVAIKASSRHGQGLLSATPAPVLRGGESYISPAISLMEAATRNLTKTSNKSPIYFKLPRADFSQADQEHGIGESSMSETLQGNVSRQWTNFTPVHSTLNLQDMKMQASGSSPMVNLSSETLVKSYYKSQCHICPQNQGDQGTSMKIDQTSSNSSNLVHLKSTLNVCEVQSPKSFQIPSNSGVQQLEYNFGKSSETFGHAFGDCSIDVGVGKADLGIDTGRMQKESDLIKVDVCKLRAKVEGTVVGPGRQAVFTLQDKEDGSSRTESLHLEDILTCCPSPHPLTSEHQWMDTNFNYSRESCMDLGLKNRWVKRLRRTPHSDEKMLQSTSSDKVVEDQWQRGQIPGQGIVSNGNIDLEAVQKHHTTEITKAFEGSQKCARINACGHDAGQKYNVPQCISNQGDLSSSCLGKRPHWSDHVGSPSLFSYTGLVHNSAEQNVAGSIQPCLENRTLQAEARPSSKVVSFSSQQKVDITAVLSQPWIQRWCPAYQIASSPMEKHRLSTSYRGINLERLKQKLPFTPMKKSQPCGSDHLYPVKLLPSAAAMAIVGIATRQLQPCQRQHKGSLSVWTAVGFTVNGAAE